MTVRRPLAMAFALALLSSTVCAIDRAAFERSTPALFERSGAPGTAAALVEAGRDRMGARLRHRRMRRRAARLRCPA